MANDNIFPEGKSPYEMILLMSDKQLSCFLMLIIDISRNFKEKDEVDIINESLILSQDYEKYFDEDREEIL